jgi:hypothetical protein
MTPGARARSGRPWRSCLGGLLLVAAFAAPAAAQEADNARDIARALETRTVYVHPGAREILDSSDAASLRRRIARRDEGRIHVAVVPRRVARRAGSIEALANAVDSALDGRGVLLLTTGPEAYVVTSYRPVDPTLQAVRATLGAANGRPLAARLATTVDAVAALDPGPRGDIAAATPAPTPAAETPFLDDIADAFKIGVAITVAAILLPPLLIVAVVLLRLRRNRRRREDYHALATRDARGELLALGDEIRALDIDESMPDANPQGAEEYSRALDLYDRANLLLSGDEDLSEIELYEAQRALHDARARLGAASAHLAGRLDIYRGAG